MYHKRRRLLRRRRGCEHAERNAVAKFILRHFSRQRSYLSYHLDIRDPILLSRAEYSLESIHRTGHNNRIENLMLIIIDKLLLLFTDPVLKVEIRFDFYNALCCVWAMDFPASFHWRLKRPRHVSTWQTVDTQSISSTRSVIMICRSREIASLYRTEKKSTSHGYQFVVLISIIKRQFTWSVRRVNMERFFLSKQDIYQRLILDVLRQRHNQFSSFSLASFALLIIIIDHMTFINE